MRPSAQKSLQQVRHAFRRGYTAVPLVREVPEDTFTPVEAYLRLTAAAGPSFLLESVEGGERLARYSFLGARPFELISVRQGRVLSSSPERGRIPGPGDAFRELGRRLMRFRAPREPGLPPFCGGAVGYVGYEMFRHLEPCVALPPPDEDEARFMLCADVVVFDRLRHRLLLIANVMDGPGPLARRYGRAARSLDEMQRLLRRPSRPAQPVSRTAPEKLQAALGEAAYCAGVRRLKSRIRAGDIFQAVL
ncbi:MAG: anthranilate synthase component I, partial [Elusimicrobia bacterium]|nr:anthranilate synthase component I [Elusimicrobiota bacterium]